MSLVTLICAIVGVKGLFSIKIDRSELVSELKRKIKKLNANKLAKLDAPDLELFLATKDGAWLPSEGPIGVKLNNGETDSDIKQLASGDPLNDTWSIEEVLVANNMTRKKQNVPKSQQIHVLVKLPERSSSVKRLRLRKVETVPRVNIEGVDYVTLPAELLEKCGLTRSMLMLYCRDQVRELWDFLKEEVIEKNNKGFIAGPPGTGKSVSTLCFLASLDHQEWNVAWLHLGMNETTCFCMGSKEDWVVDALAEFELPRVANKRLLLCVDGAKHDPEHKNLLTRIYGRLESDERVVICSSMAALGKRKTHEDEMTRIKFFFMCSWTKAEYCSAVQSSEFYDTVAAKFDARSECDVNDEDVQELDADEKKSYTLDLKFYYAGGSCRFMFQFSTSQVMAALNSAIGSVQDKTELIKYSSGAVHSETINTLYGMERHQELGGELFPISSYVASVFAKVSGVQIIADLAERLNTSNNPSLDGHILEWLFLASVPRYAVKLADCQGGTDVLPQAAVLKFDPKKRFKQLRDGSIKGDSCWLQPVAWNQGGYDAVYFVEAEEKVIFIQVTRSKKHDFKMRYFSEVLLKLNTAGMRISNVVVYFVTTKENVIDFKVDTVEDRGVLEEYDSSWTRPEEDHVKTREFVKPLV